MKKAAKRSKISKKAAAERVMGLLAAGIIFIGLAIVILAFWLGGSTTWMKIVGKVLLADVFIAVFLLLALSSFKDKSGVVGTIFKVAFWNMQLWLVVIQLIFPSMLILLGLITIVLLPYSLVNFLLKGLLIVVEISQQTIVFLSLSMGAIVTAHYSKPLFKELPDPFPDNLKQFLPALPRFGGKGQSPGGRAHQFGVLIGRLLALRFGHLVRLGGHDGEGDAVVEEELEHLPILARGLVADVQQQ